MNRVITVKGTGKVNTKPDIIILSLDLNTYDIDYNKTMELASMTINHIQKLINELGFEKSDLKTTNFNISTD